MNVFHCPSDETIFADEKTSYFYYNELGERPPGETFFWKVFKNASQVPVLWDADNYHGRAHIILLLSEQRPWSLIAAVLFCSTATIDRWKTRFESGGVDCLLEERRGRRWVSIPTVSKTRSC